MRLTKIAACASAAMLSSTACAPLNLLTAPAAHDATTHSEEATERVIALDDHGEPLEPAAPAADMPLPTALETYTPEDAELARLKAIGEIARAAKRLVNGPLPALDADTVPAVERLDIAAHAAQDRRARADIPPPPLEGEALAAATHSEDESTEATPSALPDTGAVPAEQPLPRWEVKSGEDLSDALARWTTRTGVWTTVKDTRFKWPIDADAAFEAPFLDAISQLQQAMAHRNPAPQLSAYRANHVILIEDNGRALY